MPEPLIPAAAPPAECGQHWGQDCTARDWGHVCILPKGHPIDHLCVCKARIACVCICHVPDSGVTSHVRPCCINWVGDFWGQVGDAYPLIEARIRRDMAKQIRSIPDDDEGFRTGVRRFIDRHARLVEGTSIVAVLLAVADEIEKGSDRV